MRTLLYASVAALALGGLAPAAMAQNATGNPHSTTASNITGSDTHSSLAPALPAPGGDMLPDQLLRRASADIRAGRTGAAQEALEEAETRLLDRSTAPANAGMPDSGPRVDAIRKALQALAGKDRAGAQQSIQMAMAGGGADTGAGNTMSGGAAPMPAGGEAMAPAAAPPPPPTAMPNGMNNNPAGLSGGSGNEASGPAQ